MKLRLVVSLDILFPSRNMRIVLSCGLCLVRRNGSIASLDLMGWVCLGIVSVVILAVGGGLLRC